MPFETFFMKVEGQGHEGQINGHKLGLSGS